MTPLDRQASFKADSPKRCILVTQGSLLRDLCRDHPQLQSFIQSCRVAINDEAQQGGQAGFTILAGFLSIHCLQILTGDKEQNRSGTGGEPTKEALLERLALKSVGFLNNTTALFPWEFAKDVGRALRQFPPFTSSLPTVPDVHCLLASLSSCALTSPLNQRRFSVAIFVAIPSTARSGSQWFWVDIENNIIGTPTIPLESAHFHCD